MYIDIKRQIARTRVAGAISWTGRTVLAGEDVKISSYMDRKGLYWTVATWDLDYDFDPTVEIRREQRIKRALRTFVQNYIRKF